MRVGQLAKEHVALHVDVPGEGDGVNIVYHPGALTLEVADRLKEVAAEGFDPDAALVVLEPILVSWDLEDDDGQPLPCDRDGIKKVPIAFLGLLMQKIAEDSQPDPQTGGTSDDTSPPTERVGGSLSGT